MPGSYAYDLYSYSIEREWISKIKKLRHGDVIRYRVNFSNEEICVVLHWDSSKPDDFTLKPLFSSKTMKVRGVRPHEVIGHIEVPDEWR